MKKIFSSSPHSSAKDVFYHLLATVTLYVSVISFIALLWQYINVKFPDQLDYYHTGTLDIIRQSTATLLVVWPVYIFMSWLISRDVNQAGLQKRQLAIRKWLFYLTLFVAAVTIIVDLVTLIYNFLGGELSVKFYLKVLVVLVTAGAVFGYYLWDLNQKTLSKNSLPKKLAWTTSIIVFLTIIGGFLVVGSPSQQRARRFDEQRVNDLQMIQNEIINHWQQKNALPAILDELKNNISGFSPGLDPETNHPYEYLITNPSNLEFQLCAIFKTDSRQFEKNNQKPSRPMGFYGPYDQNWEHTTGRVCFTRTIDPELYKSNSPVKQKTYGDPIAPPY